MDGHFVQFYEGDAFLVDEVTRFIGSGLMTGDAGVVIATQAHRDALRLRLQPPASDTGAYIVLDAEATLARFMVDGSPDAKRFTDTLGDVIRRAGRNGARRVRAFGEMVAVLWDEGKPDAAIQLERLWNDLAKKHSFSLFCAYPMRAFERSEDGKAFMHVCAEHTHVRPTETFRIPSDDVEALNRIVARLQQKASALETEVARRKETEQALARRERELADFVENALEGLHKVGPDGSILWANQAELDLLGYAPEEYIGHHVAEFHVDRRSCEKLLASLQAGDAVYDYPAQLRCKDGSVRHVLIHSNALVENGRFAYTRCYTRDVTDRTCLEAELRQRMDQLAELDRRKDEFMAMLGHELRNPLAPIVNSIEIMKLQGDDPKRITRAREIIERQVALMTRLVDDLLDISRLTSGKIELRREVVSLATIVERAVELGRPLIDERGHRLSLDVPADAILLEADPARLAQVLANILHNAAKYTGPGGHITLSARRAGGEVLVAVRDNGVGLARDMCDRIFDLFVQGPDALAQARGGLGIGLTLVRKLVELHGGSVQARSEGPGRGSEFEVRLPLADVAPIAPRDPDNRDAVPVRRRRVLIVDDNADAAQSLAECLRMSGHEVRYTSDGAGAVADAACLRPEVVILDIGMPTMDGYEVLKRLRALPAARSALIVALTGFAQERDVQCAIEAGFDHHFAKPIDFGRLSALLQSAA
jgi:PAS domain S-box-containing protein